MGKNQIVLVTKTEAAEIAGVDERTIARWRAAGRLTPHGYEGPPGRRKAMYDRAEVESAARWRRVVAVPTQRGETR